MKKLVFGIIVFFLFSCFVCAKESVSFSECVDGDTAWFLVDKERVKFRFLGIDTPESVHPTKEVEAYGKDASEYTCNRLKAANEILVEYDSKSSKTDKYGRNLAWIWVDGNLLQEDLIRIGYATVSYVYGKYSYIDSLCYAQSIAKNDGLGVWNDKKKEEGYCSTIDYSKASYVNESVGDIINNDGETVYYYVISGIVGVGVLAGFIKKNTAKKIMKYVKE